MAGCDVVIATATASGKSLCYQLPIVQAALDEPDARALLLFPTKALARDQVEAMRDLASPFRVGTGTYDGDTPPDERRATRARAHVVATNPDMLHRAILPNHDRWSALLASLRYVVLDEMHTYRGVFGSHVAHVLRRLLRLCAHHGANPTLVGCSATIANPRELMSLLTARGAASIELVDEDTAPKGARSFVVVNPTIVDATTGVRRDYLKVARRVTGAFRRAGVRTLAFCRTRKAVELLTRYLQEDETAEESTGRRGDRSGGAPDGPHAGAMQLAARDRAAKSIRGYRGGYLPEHRRAVEKALRDGEARVVATTSALELGMDIGGLDGVVLAGYPGTRAATWQRSGRAGRKHGASLTALVLSSRPLDQCIANAPGFLFDEPPEHARIDPENPEVSVPHLRCAAHELPFFIGGSAASQGAVNREVAYPGLAHDDLVGALDYLVEMGSLHVERDAAAASTYFSIGASFPADAVDLRGTLEENFEVIEQYAGYFEHGRVLAEVDFADGPLYLHPGAIYPLEGKTYEVRRLDWDGRKAFVREVAAAYYTEAIIEMRVRVLEPGPREGDGTGTVRGAGYGQVVRAVPAFKKLRFRTHENIGFGPVNVPELDLQTSIAWWTPSMAWLCAVSDPRRRADATIGAAHVLHHVGAMVCMCDVRDLGRAIGAGAESDRGGAWAMTAGRRNVDVERESGGRATIYLYDSMAGGAGLSPRLFELGPAFIERAAALVEHCACRHGCPTCVGADVLEPGPRIGLRDGPAALAEPSQGSGASLRGDVLALLRDLGRVERSA